MGEEVQRGEGLEDSVVEKRAAIELGGKVKSPRCAQCPRVFSTGKALGGHMSSAHGPSKKSDSSPKNLKSKKNHESFQAGKFTCKCCGKSFSSEKGVHGHMRLHPERDRRAMKPPAESEIENPVDILE
ncbi:hypothetical protein F511_41667 [Dorcoceras hygrometricum]|uniref:C2H2-type domain-containing protein n=1 Tax=Dorcoceras hygrometricum TaxID=472368 RepID=A0A2Z7B6V6_9LAMI|nr:hypothetical protein F511_41667 [Dorcoceras hygrometricum]